MSWGLVLIAVAIAIGWRRARIDRLAVVSMLFATVLALAYAYRSLGS